MPRHTIHDAIRLLGVRWYEEVRDARRGDFKAMITSLRSSKKIPEDEERWLREVIAAALAGELKRKRGRPPSPDWALRMAVGDVRAFKQIEGKKGRVRGVELEAIDVVAKEWGSIPKSFLTPFTARELREQSCGRHSAQNQNSAPLIG